MQQIVSADEGIILHKYVVINLLIHTTDMLHEADLPVDLIASSQVVVRQRLLHRLLHYLYTAITRCAVIYYLPSPSVAIYEVGWDGRRVAVVDAGIGVCTQQQRTGVAEDDVREGERLVFQVRIAVVIFQTVDEESVIAMRGGDTRQEPRRSDRLTQMLVMRT